MEDTISRDKLLDDLIDTCNSEQFGDEEGQYARGFDHAMSLVADVINRQEVVNGGTVRHAYWIGSNAWGEADGYPVYDTFECSECHDWHDNCDGTPPPHNYCPNCGAKMDGGVNDG